MAFAKFNAIPHYAYLKLKMPSPVGIIMINGNTECSLRTKEHITTLAAKDQSGTKGPRYQPVPKGQRYK